jgi:hypothetical protein
MRTLQPLLSAKPEPARCTMPARVLATTLRFDF